jgi:hypothetical protein
VSDHGRLSWAALHSLCEKQWVNMWWTELVVYGCCNKSLQTHGFRPQKCILSQTWVQKVWNHDWKVCVSSKYYKESGGDCIRT